MSHTSLTASSDLPSLASDIQSGARTRPIVVVVARAAGGYRFDVNHIVDELGEYCDIFTVEDSATASQLSELTGQNLMAPEGIAAVWGAVSLGDDGLRFSFAPQTETANGVFRATGRIVGEARTMAYRSGLFDQPSESAVAVRGVVSQMFAGSAVIRPHDGQHGAVVPQLLSVLEETTFPGVPISWYLSVGQEVSGTWDPQSRNFTLDRSVWTVKDLVEAYPYQSVTLGMFTAVDRQTGRIAIHPSLPMEVSRSEISSNNRDLVKGLFSEGDIVRVRVYRNAQGETRLRLDDIDDSEVALPAPVLVEGGQPWLEQEHNAMLEQMLKQFEDEPHHDDELRVAMNDLLAKLGVSADLDALMDSIIAQATDDAGDSGDSGESGDSGGSGESGDPGVSDPFGASEGPRPIPGAGGIVRTTAGAHTTTLVSPKQASLDAFALKRMRGELAAAVAVRDRIQAQYGELLTELANAKEVVDLMRKQRADLQAKLSEARKDTARLSQQTSTIASRRERFDSDAEWLREEIRRTWLAIFKPADRATHNIETEMWEFGPHFVNTFIALDAGEQRKALRVIVNVVSRRNARENVYHEHALRTGDSVSAPELRRPNGDACWRVHLEKGVSQAKRLHYWRRKDGYFELARIADHDVYEA